MYNIEEPFTLTPHGLQNQKVSPDKTVILGHYRQAHGQFLLSVELKQDTSFQLILAGMGVVKMNTFQSTRDAIDWIQSGQPMTQPGQRVRSKLHKIIKFSAKARDCLEFWPVRAGHVETPRDKFTLPLRGPSTVLAFDIECGDVRVSVTDIVCPQYLVQPFTSVFHPLHAKELKLVPIRNGSQVKLTAPAQQSLTQVNGKALTPESVLFLRVEGASRKCDTGCYFRLWTSCDSNCESTDTRQQTTSGSPTTSKITYTHNSSMIFPITPCSFQTFVVVVKSNQLLIHSQENSQLKGTIVEDFANSNHTLWVEFYKIGFTIVKTDLSWDWTEQNGTALGPGIPEAQYNTDVLIGMNIPPHGPIASSSPNPFPELSRARGYNGSEENNFVISNNPNNYALDANLIGSLYVNKNEVACDNNRWPGEINGNQFTFPPLPSIPSVDENHNTNVKQPQCSPNSIEGSYMSLLSSQNGPPEPPRVDLHVFAGASAAGQIVTSPPIPCPASKIKAKSKGISGSSPLKGLTKMFTSLRKPRSNSARSSDGSPPVNNDPCVNHGFFDHHDEYETPVRHQSRSPPNDNSQSQRQLPSFRHQNRSPPNDNSQSQQQLPSLGHRNRSPPNDNSPNQRPLPNFPDELTQRSRNNFEFSCGSREDHYYEKVDNDLLDAMSSYNSDEVVHQTVLKSCSS